MPSTLNSVRSSSACWSNTARTRSEPETIITWTPEAAEKGGYEHFMLKEIHEQPRAVRDTLLGRIGLSHRIASAVARLERDGSG